MSYPTQSGWFERPQNTPYDHPKWIAVDNPYLTVAEFLRNELALGLGITANSPIVTSGRMKEVLQIASAEVNRMCRRWFDTQTIDETKTGLIVRPWNPQLVTVDLQNAPYQKIHSIFFQVLKWFIQIDSDANGYLQDFPDLGFYKIVPLLSNSGTGVGSPMPAEIVDKTPLGVLWTEYTFGYGKILTGQALSQPSGLTDNLKYQAPLGNQLWAPDQTINVYQDGVLLTLDTDYTFDAPDGLVTLKVANDEELPITADFTTNETVPFDIKQATAMLAGDYVGQGQANPLGASGYSIQTFSISWSGNGKNGQSALRLRAEALLKPFMFNTPVII